VHESIARGVLTSTRRCRQVETTFSKGMMRITTTAVGGGLAAIVMNWSVLARNPYYLSLFILPFDFVVGLGMFTQASCFLPSQCHGPVPAYLN